MFLLVLFAYLPLFSQEFLNVRNCFREQQECIESQLDFRCYFEKLREIKCYYNRENCFQLELDQIPIKEYEAKKNCTICKQFTSKKSLKIKDHFVKKRKIRNILLKNVVFRSKKTGKRIDIKQELIKRIKRRIVRCELSKDQIYYELNQKFKIVTNDKKGYRDRFAYFRGDQKLSLPLERCILRKLKRLRYPKDSVITFELVVDYIRKTEKNRKVKKEEKERCNIRK